MPVAVNGIIPSGIAVGGKTQVLVCQNGEKVWEAEKNDFEFIPPYVCENTMGKLVTELEVYGKSVQDDTPSPENPVEIESVGGELTIGDSTVTIPTLYSVGDVSDVLHVDHSQKRAWVERNCWRYTPTSSITFYGVYGRGTNTIRYTVRVSDEGYPIMKSTQKRVLCNYLPSADSSNFTADYALIFVHTAYVLFLSIPYSALDITAEDDNTTSIAAMKYWLTNQNPAFEFIYVLNTPTTEELDYNDYKTLTASTATTVTTDSPVSPKIVLTTYVSATPDPSTSYYAQVLTALGVEAAGTIEEQEAQLSALGVDPWA